MTRFYRVWHASKIKWVLKRTKYTADNIFHIYIDETRWWADSNNVIGGTHTVWSLELYFSFLTPFFFLLDDTAQIPFARCFITTVFIYVTFVSSLFPPEWSATSDSLALSFLCPNLLPIYQTSTATYISSSEQKCTCLPSCDLSFSHHATRLSVLFWMAGFLVSSKSLQNASRLFLFRQVIIQPVLEAIRTRKWTVRCSGLRDSKRSSGPGSSKKQHQFRGTGGFRISTFHLSIEEQARRSC
jgi:hypothetical protein